jgi:hypothetical protein
VCVGVNQPWLDDELTPGFDHYFTGTKKIGTINVLKSYTWFGSDTLWEYEIKQYYQQQEGKSFFRLTKKSSWEFWIIDPLAEVETTL